MAQDIFYTQESCGVGDWAAVIAGLPHQAALRTVMAIFGAAFYYLLRQTDRRSACVPS